MHRRAMRGPFSFIATLYVLFERQYCDVVRKRHRRIARQSDTQQTLSLSSCAFARKFPAAPLTKTFMLPYFLTVKSTAARALSSDLYQSSSRERDRERQFFASSINERTADEGASEKKRGDRGGWPRCWKGWSGRSTGPE